MPPGPDVSYLTPRRDSNQDPAIASAVKGPYAVRKANSDGSPPCARVASREAVAALTDGV